MRRLAMGSYILSSPHTNVYPQTFWPNASQPMPY